MKGQLINMPAPGLCPIIASYIQYNSSCIAHGPPVSVLEDKTTSPSWLSSRSLTSPSLIIWMLLFIPSHWTDKVTFAAQEYIHWWYVWLLTSTLLLGNWQQRGRCMFPVAVLACSIRIKVWHIVNTVKTSRYHICISTVKSVTLQTLNSNFPVKQPAICCWSNCRNPSVVWYDPSLFQSQFMLQRDHCWLRYTFSCSSFLWVWLPCYNIYVLH